MAITYSTCTFPDCGRRVVGGGLCGGHYKQHRLGKPLTKLQTYKSKAPRSNGVTCEVDFCEATAVYATHCRPHRRQFLAGQPFTPVKKSIRGVALKERLSATVERQGDCLIWTGSIGSHGYGTLTYRRESWVAHRAAWVAAGNELIEGMVLDHKCRNRKCINVDHLHQVTDKVNAENHSGLMSTNTSGVRGVCWDKNRNMWLARVRHYGKEHHVGRFDSLEEAEAAVIAKRNELFTNNLLDRVS